MKIGAKAQAAVDVCLGLHRHFSTQDMVAICFWGEERKMVKVKAPFLPTVERCRENVLFQRVKTESCPSLLK